MAEMVGRLLSFRVHSLRTLGSEVFLLFCHSYRGEMIPIGPALCHCIMLDGADTSSIRHLRTYRTYCATVMWGASSLYSLIRCTERTMSCMVSSAVWRYSKRANRSFLSSLLLDGSDQSGVVQPGRACSILLALVRDFVGASSTVSLHGKPLYQVPGSSAVSHNTT
jgi:hypothetical protein